MDIQAQAYLGELSEDPRPLKEKLRMGHMNNIMNKYINNFFIM